MKMEQFKINTRATLLHINTRKEGNEDDKTLALDLKLTTRISSEIANFFGEGLKDFLFLDDGEPRFKRMEQVGFEHELRGYLLILNEQSHYGADVKKFKVQPVKGNQIDLTFSVSFKPISQVVATLAEFLSEQISIELLPQNTELNFNGTNEIIETLSGLASGEGANDPLFEDAKAIVTNSRRASISVVQKHLRIGYNRSARLIESLELAGVVSAMQSDGSRVVL